MPLTRPRFDVYVNGTAETPDVHHVTITHQDQLRAEQALVGLDIDQSRVLAMTTAWCWAALRRTEAHRGPLQRFLDTECAGVEQASEGATSEAVDPTREAADTGSASTSPGATGGPGSTG